MSKFTLKGKIVLVTGASSGIGRQAAIDISEAGGHLIITGRTREKLNAVFKKLKGIGHFSIPADLTAPKDVEFLINKTPALDGVVHSAGIVKPFPVKFIGPKNVDEVFRINYLAPVTLMSGLFKINKINNKASVVFISSVSTRVPYLGGAIYSGSKSAIEAYSKTLALEYACRGLRSNCLLPAMVKTPMFDIFNKNEIEEHGKNYPLGFGLPEDIAQAIVFLLSDASRWITGTEIVLDGGLLLKNKK